MFFFGIKILKIQFKWDKGYMNIACEFSYVMDNNF